MVKVFAVANSTYFIENNKVYAVGHNNHGQLGLGDIRDRNIPDLIWELNDKNIVNIIGGENQIFAISENGDVYVWGYNFYGQLGLGNNSNELNPVKNETLSNFRSKEIKAGCTHSLLLTEGKLYSWGYNGHGQLGLGDNEDRNVPTEIKFFSQNNIHIKNVYAGQFAGFAITEDNRLYAWGYNGYGQLGLGHKNNQLTPCEVSFFRGIPIKNIVSLDVSTFVLTESGKVYSFGLNDYGQLGLGHDDYKLTPQLINVGGKTVDKIITGWNSTIAITTDGEIYGWGYNSYYVLGPIASPKTPVQLTHIQSLNPVDIKMGNYHTIVKTQTGDIYVFGLNTSGQLGLGHNNSPISIPTKLNLNFILQ